LDSVYITESGLPQPEMLALLVDPRNESTLYLATTPASGTFWKSTDAGASWTRAAQGLPGTGAFANVYLTIALNNVLYLRLDTAIYRTEDGAAAWTRIPAPLPGNAAPFDINRSNPRQMLYASRDAVWRSNDEGVTWQVVTALQTFQDAATGASCLATEPALPNIVYACVAGSLIRVGNTTVTGLHRSTNNGDSFTPPAPLPAPILQPIRAFVDQLSGSLLLLQSSAGGYCKSQDRGQNIRCFPDSVFGANGANIQPTSVRLQYLDRLNGSVVYASATRANSGATNFRSRDGGETWQALESRGTVTLGKRTTPLTLLLAPDGVATLPLPVAPVDMPQRVIPFTASTSGQPWFSINAPGGNTPATLTVTFRAAGLTPGERYEGSIRLASPQAANEAVIPVVLQVARPATAPAPLYSLSIIAGDGDAGPIGDTQAIAAERGGSVLFIATTQSRIRRITPAGVIDTIAGNGTAASAADGANAAQSPLNSPRNLAVDSGGTVYFGEANGVVRRITAGALGTAVPRGPLTIPSALALDRQDRLWITDLGRIYRHNPPSQVSQLALNPATAIVGPAGFAIDESGNMYVSESALGRIHRITPAGQISLFAGNGSTITAEGVPALSTGLDSPAALAADRRGNLFFVESRRNRVRVINPAGIVYTISAPEGRILRQLAAGPDGEVYVSASNFILKLTPAPAEVPVVSARPRNLASGEESVSPGTLFYLDGERLASTEMIAEPPYPDVLGGASVTINGVAAPLKRVSPNRIEGLIPPDLPVGEAVASVTVNGAPAGQMTFTLAAASPGIFTAPEDPARAAAGAVAMGEASVLVTGFGPVDPDGKAVLPFRAAIGEIEAAPVEIAAVAGMPGVGRAAFRLPDGLMPGDYPVTIQIGEAASNAAIITVPAP